MDHSCAIGDFHKARYFVNGGWRTTVSNLKNAAKKYWKKEKDLIADEIARDREKKKLRNKK